MKKKKKGSPGQEKFFLFLSCSVLAVVMLFYFLRGESEKAPDKKSPLIGISDVFNARNRKSIEKGIEDELSRLGYTPRYDLRDMADGSGGLEKNAEKFKREKADITVGLSAPAAVALAKVIKDIPVVFASAVNPVKVKLVPSFNHPSGNNVTGISDMPPVHRQFEMIQEILHPKVVGHIYNARDPHSLFVARMAESEAEQWGFHLMSIPVTEKSEISSAAESLVHEVQAVYLSRDDMLEFSVDDLLAVTRKHKIPIFSSDPEKASGIGGISLAYGFNYYEIGVHAGEMIADILEGKNPGDILFQFPKEKKYFTFFIDKELLKEQGYGVPENIFRKVEHVLRPEKSSTEEENGRADKIKNAGGRIRADGSPSPGDHSSDLRNLPTKFSDESGISRL